MGYCSVAVENTARGGKGRFVCFAFFAAAAGHRCFFLPPEEGNLSEMCNFALSKPRPVRPTVCLA